MSRFDPHIEAYIFWLADEHQRLGGGPISEHYLRCIDGSYR